MKKLIALIMSFTVFTSVSAFAAQPSDEVVSDLAKYNIISDTSDLRPDDNITRAEVVKMLCEMDGYNPDVQMNSIFTDVPASHWAAVYITAGYYDGMINGYGDGTFRPEQNVTQNELQTMIVSLLGYDLLAESDIFGYDPMTMKAYGYPDGYATVAHMLGILENVDFDGDAPATRADAMQMIYNALDVPLANTQGAYMFGKELPSIIVVHDGLGSPLETFRLALDGKIVL